ncbi:MAG: hypothetical protein AAGG38_04190 [Planctomycetota bacterium]
MNRWSKKHAGAKWWGWLCAAALAVGLGGCLTSKGGGGGGEGVDLSEAWQPEPVALRIYPSTRFVNEGDVTLLEARVELFDQMGDSVKASGRLRFELYASGYAPGIDVGRLLFSWDLALTRLEDQRRYYDPVTRSYLLRLRLDSREISRRQVLLRVTFEPSDEERLTDEQVIRVEW